MPPRTGDARVFLRILGRVVKTAYPKTKIGTSQPLLVKASTVAAAMSCTSRWVLMLEAQGIISSYRIGKRSVRFHLPSVLEALGAGELVAADGGEDAK